MLDQTKIDSLFGRVFNDLAAGYGGVMVNIGDRLGLYKALAGAGPLSSHELARRTGCAERYVREWLNSQVAGGYVDYHPASSTYEMSAEQAAILADEKSPYFMPFAWRVVSTLWSEVPRTVDSFKTGKGIGWGEHGEGLICGVASFYRNGYQANLVQGWLPKLEGVTEKLAAGGKVADVGCGHGHSTVLMAKAFPKSRFWGFDAHEGSIAEARKIAEEAGVADRVTFEVAKADGYARRGYDLICFFDCLHDMGRPVEAARHAAAALAEDGTLMTVEPFAHDKVEDNVGPVGRVYYAASSTMCCPHAISENGTHVLGAQAGPRQLTDILTTAGFRTVRRVAESPFNLVLEARR